MVARAEVVGLLDGSLSFPVWISTRAQADRFMADKIDLLRRHDDDGEVARLRLSVAA